MSFTVTMMTTLRTFAILIFIISRAGKCVCELYCQGIASFHSSDIDHCMQRFRYAMDNIYCPWLRYQTKARVTVGTRLAKSGILEKREPERTGLNFGLSICAACIESQHR